MSLKKIYQIIQPVIILTCLIIAILAYSKRTKVAFVRSAVLIENFTGMKEVRAVYDKKVQEWNKKIDTLMLIYNTSVDYLNENKHKLPAAQIKLLEEKIEMQKQNVTNYSSQVEEDAKKENEKLTQGVYNQINSFIEQYGKEHNIDIIIGANLSGNVLFGKDKLDLTEDILKKLNDAYK